MTELLSLEFNRMLTSVKIEKKRRRREEEVYSFG